MSSAISWEEELIPPSFLPSSSQNWTNCIGRVTKYEPAKVSIDGLFGVFGLECPDGMLAIGFHWSGHYSLLWQCPREQILAPSVQRIKLVRPAMQGSLEQGVITITGHLCY